MFLKPIMVLFLCWFTTFTWADDKYYQADPAKHAALEAKRCADYKKQTDIIRRRLTGPVVVKSDIEKMHKKLESLQLSIAKYCPADAEK